MKPWQKALVGLAILLIGLGAGHGLVHVFRDLVEMLHGMDQ